MGILYFKPEYQFQLSYNPFALLLSELPDEEKGKLVEPIPNSEAKTGIGPFSILSALKIYGHISKDEKSRASIKPYCIETKLGYWVPSCYKDEFEGKLLGSNKSKKDKYVALNKKILKISDEDIIKEYHRYRDSVKEHLESANVPYEKYIDKINEDKTISIYDPFLQ